MAQMILVEELTKRYRRSETNAVDGISFEVRAGELFCLLGPNGAGKTTTISVLTTILAPTSGRVLIAGRDALAEASAVRREVGIIFQQASLDLNLTAEENVRFHALLYGLYPYRPAYALMPASYRRQVRDLASVLGIEDQMGRPVRTFSGGMRRKLEVVRTLMHHPRVLFLDEPTAGLDPASRRGLWEYLRQIRRERETTLFLSTHYLEESEEADAICILNHGRVISRGTPAQVKSELVEEYVLLDSHDRASLRAELRRLGASFTEPPPFRVSLQGRTVHQLARSVETPLSVLETHAPSLEDAYLRIVGAGAA